MSNFTGLSKDVGLADFDLSSKDAPLLNFERNFECFGANGRFVSERMIVINKNHGDYSCPAMAKSQQFLELTERIAC